MLVQCTVRHRFRIRQVKRYTGGNFPCLRNGVSGVFAERAAARLEPPSRVEMCCRSLQVVGFPGFTS